MKCKKLPIILLVGVTLSTPALAQKYVVEQKNKQFAQNGKQLVELVIKKNDVITFTNSDTIKHSVFSLSDAKLFDLGSTKPGVSKDVLFDREGQVDIECSVHSEMYLKVIVQ